MPEGLVKPPAREAARSVAPDRPWRTVVVMQCPERDDGFTLVEIIVAVVLVALLSAVVVTGVGRLSEDATGAACGASVDAARAALTPHIATIGAHADGFDDLVSTGSLTLSAGVVVSADPRVLQGDGWTATLTPDPAGGAPTIACSNGTATVAPTTAAPTTTLGPQVLDLGGFEEGRQAPYGGWVMESTGWTEGPWTIVSALSRDHAAHHGGNGTVGHHVDLDATGVIRRDVTGLVVGRTYVLTWVTASHQAVTNPSARVTIAGETLTWTPTVKSNQVFQTRELEFTATSTTHQLEFRAVSSPNGCCGVLVDDPVIRSA